MKGFTYGLLKRKSELGFALVCREKHQLYLKQKALLDQFLEKGAISQAQHDKSLRDLIEKMDKKE